MSEIFTILTQDGSDSWTFSFAKCDPAKKRRSRGHPLSDDVAKSTWKLKRLRRPVSLTARQSQLLQEATTAGRIDANKLFYGDTVFTLRPTVAAMLIRLWLSPLRIFPVDELSNTVYGRPVSLRAIRQTVFRINRAFENVGCPMFAYCHASTVYLRPRFRSFDRVLRNHLCATSKTV